VILHAADQREPNKTIAITKLAASIERQTEKIISWPSTYARLSVFLSLGDASQFVFPPPTRRIVCATRRPVTDPQRIISDNRERSRNRHGAQNPVWRSNESALMASGITLLVAWKIRVVRWIFELRGFSIWSDTLATVLRPTKKNMKHLHNLSCVNITVNSTWFYPSLSLGWTTYKQNGTRWSHTTESQSECLINWGQAILKLVAHYCNRNTPNIMCVCGSLANKSLANLMLRLIKS
jgi:hypothetical protein